MMGWPRRLLSAWKMKVIKYNVLMKDYKNPAIQYVSVLDAIKKMNRRLPCR